MNKISGGIFRLVLFCTIVSVWHSGARAQQTYDIENHPLRVALRERVMPVVREKGAEAASITLSHFKADMLGEGFPAYDVYEHVWKEAQLHVRDNQLSYAFYEWIFMDSTHGDLSGKTRCYSDTILYNALINLSQDEGKLARAEKWIQVSQRMAEIQYGIVYDLNRYPDTAEDLHPAFPGVKNKKFPLRYSEQLKASARAQPHFVDHSRLSTHAQIMRHAFSRGDWKSAMLFAEWIKQFSDALTAEPDVWDTHSRQELDQMNSDAIALQAELMWLMGKREFALRHLERVMAERPAYYYGTHHRRGMTAVRWRAAMGKQLPEDLEYLDSRLESMSHNRFFNGHVMGRRNLLTRIWWLHRNDRREEALTQMAAYFQERQKPMREDWELYLDLILEEKDLRPESEEVFLRLLEDYRKKGEKIYEPFLYEKYARWLSWQGRFAEAQVIQKEAARLYAAFEMDEMREKALAILAEYQRMAAEAVKVVAAPAPAAPLPLSYEARPAEAYRVDLPPATVDLQPGLMQSLHAENLPAHALFSLANPGDQLLKGELEISPAAEVEVDQEDHLMSVRFEADAGGGEARIPLELEAGRLLSLRLESFSRHPEGGKVQLRWKPSGGGEGLEANWTYVQGEGFGKGDFSSAGAYLHNPFYLVPIYQSLLRDPSPEAGRLDFRVVASEPLRLEVYQLADEQPVYIDDQGDGDLNGVGDVLARDGNRNGWPDLDFAPGRVDAGFVIYFQPRPDRPPGPVVLRLQLLLDGKWETRAVHTIEFKK